MEVYIANMIIDNTVYASYEASEIEYAIDGILRSNHELSWTPDIDIWRYQLYVLKLISEVIFDSFPLSFDLGINVWYNLIVSLLGWVILFNCWLHRSLLSISGIQKLV